MVDTKRSRWEQPMFDAGLEGVAVDLITGVVQDTFRRLDPVALVQSLDSGCLSRSEKLKVADLIDRAVVELEVNFSGEPVGHPRLAE